jgi:predicted dehydrogenase
VLLGPVTGVYAEWRVRDSGRDDDVFVALTHGGGARSHLWGSWSQGAPGDRFRSPAPRAPTSSAGRWTARRTRCSRGTRRPRSGDRWGAEPEERWGRLRRGDDGDVVPTERGRWDFFYPAFAAAVRGTGPVPVDPADAVATAAVLDAARRSATGGGVDEP